MIGFIYLLILLVSATYLGHLSERIGQPRIVGEIIGGIIVGPLAIIILEPILGPEIANFISKERASKEIMIVIDLGRILLMLGAGLETNLTRLFKSGKSAFSAAIGGMTLPLTLGYGAGIYLGLNYLGSLFLAVSMSITAVALSVSVLIEMEKLNSDPGSTIIGAAVIDDVLGIFILSILLSIVDLGKIPTNLILIREIGIAIIFLLTTLYIGPKIIKKYKIKIRGSSKSENLGITLSIVTALAIIAEISGLHAMIGAYLAGLIIGPMVGEREKEEISTWIWGFFAPIFFAWVGFSMTLTKAAFGMPLIIITVIAFIGKIAGSGIGAIISGLNKKDSLIVGIGMNARGAVELIVANIALESGLINNQIFSAIILMAMITSLTTPIAMKKLIKVAE